MRRWDKGSDLCLVTGWLVKATGWLAAEPERRPSNNPLRYPLPIKRVNWRSASEIDGCVHVRFPEELAHAREETRKIRLIGPNSIELHANASE